MNESLACQYIATGLWEVAASPLPEAGLRKLLESMDFDFDNYVDPRDAYYDRDAGEWWIGIGAGESKENASWPTVTNEDDLKAIRQECRLLATTNEFAINGHENRISYIVGTGHKYQAVAKKGVTVPGEQLAAINRELEDFCKRNRWPARQQEIVRRYDRDGEVFLRFFERDADDATSVYSYADGETAKTLPGITGRVIAVRFIEPGQVFRPVMAADQAHASFGVVTEPDDVESIVGYYVDERLIDAVEIQHRKANVDANVKRGMPLFFPVRKNLKRAEKLLRNITTTASLQAAIGLIRKHKQATGTTVRAWLNAAADVTVSNRDAGTTTRHKAYQPGTIVDASADTEYDFPAASVNVERFVAGVQAELRAIAARLVMPEFMFTSDASNANYASTLVAEGPADKMFQREQSTQEAYDLEIIDRVLDLAAEHARIPAEWRGLVKIDVHKPRVQVRDEAAEASVNKIEKDAGVLSPQTWSSRRGLDYEQEQENISQHREKYGDNDLDPNAKYALDAKGEGRPPGSDGKGLDAAAREALVRTLESCDSPLEAIAALLTTTPTAIAEHCGANAKGGGGFQPNNTCGGDGDGQSTGAKKNDVTQTEAFKRWFGDSKVVDEKGNPLVVYHGTNAEFAEFKATGSGEFGPAIYLTSSQQDASEYAIRTGGTASVLPLYAAIQNPFKGTAEEFFAKFPAASDDDSIYQARAAGFDGVITQRERITYDNAARKFVKLGGFDTHYIAFSPTQIKSATGNRGTFDPNNPDVRESAAA